MHDHDIHEAIYHKKKMHGPFVSGLGLGAGSIERYCEKVLNLLKTSLLYYIFKLNVHVVSRWL